MCIPSALSEQHWEGVGGVMPSTLGGEGLHPGILYPAKLSGRYIAQIVNSLLENLTALYVKTPPFSLV